MDLPLVSVIVTVRDDETGVADSLDDALAQDHPSAAVELIVVDDGSSDGTPELLAEYVQCFPGRIRVFRQPPTGEAAALQRGLEEVRGEIVAPLHAGDRWPRSRLSSQVSLLERRPEVGLVYSQLLWQHGDDEPAPWPAELEVDPPRGRPVARLLREECVAPSSIALRASLARQLPPIPSEIPRAGWWLTLQAAAAAEIEWLPEAPLSAPASPPIDRVARWRDELAVRRWFLRRTTSDSLFLDELDTVWAAFSASAQRLLDAGDGPFVELVPVSDADRAEARRLVEDARAAHGDGVGRAGIALAARAAAADPWCAAARELLADALAARPRRAAGDPLAGARRFVTLAFADELLAAPDLLAAYGTAFDGRADATLAIDASTLTPAAAAQALAGLVRQAGLDDEGSAHLLAVVGPIDAAVRERLPASADALLTARTRPQPAAPAFAAGEMAALRALAARASAA